MVKDQLIGQTFRSTVADGNPLWKVISKSGPDAYLCEVVNEPYEVNGRTYDGEFAGLQDVFLTKNIKRNIQWQHNWDGLVNSRATNTARFYSMLKENDVVHYHDGFSKFIRCKVRADKQLIPVGFVGNWQDYDVKPIRRPDGSLYKSYWLQRINKGEPFQPPASNLWEAMDQSERDYSMRNARPATPQQVVNLPRYEAPFDPTTEPLLSTDIPPMNEAEARIADKQRRIGEAIGLLSAVHNSTEATEDDLFAAMGKAVGTLL
jgi:hypothetical protein